MASITARNHGFINGLIVEYKGIRGVIVDNNAGNTRSPKLMIKISFNQFIYPSLLSPNLMKTNSMMSVFKVSGGIEGYEVGDWVGFYEYNRLEYEAYIYAINEEAVSSYKNIYFVILLTVDGNLIVANLDRIKHVTKEDWVEDMSCYINNSKINMFMANGTGKIKGKNASFKINTGIIEVSIDDV